MSEPTIDFVCTHTRGRRDEVPAHLPIFLRGTGNANAERLTSALAAIDAFDVDDVSFETPDGPHEEEPRNDFIDRYVHESQTVARPISDLQEAFAIRNHHELRCPTCGFTERLTNEDVEILVPWARANGLISIPLITTRRILQLAARN